ncbi:hypothetical protein KKE60_07815, partial [Patescibacteria group bacterium]|nr:hypothetical protein [Patescibacteria group bacterium]
KVPCVLDGELVSYNQDGVLQFNGIQHRANRVNGVAMAVHQYPASYEVFDILEADMDGQTVNLQNLPLMKRKEFLSLIVIPTRNVRLATYTEDGISLFRQMEADKMEGVVGKRKDGRYLEGKREWFKVKISQWGEFLVVGYTEGTGWRASTFGALVLAESDSGGHLTYVGSVGTGFNDAEISRIHQKLLQAGVVGCPFHPCPADVRDAHWVSPEIAVKIRYLEKTNDGKLRFPSYKGMV